KVLPPELLLPLSVTKPPAPPVALPPWLPVVMVGVTVMVGLAVELPPCAFSVGLKRRSLLALPPAPPKPPVAVVSPTLPPVPVPKPPAPPVAELVLSPLALVAVWALVCAWSPPVSVLPPLLEVLALSDEEELSRSM